MRLTFLIIHNRERQHRSNEWVSVLRTLTLCGAPLDHPSCSFDCLYKTPSWVKETKTPTQFMAEANWSILSRAILNRKSYYIGVEWSNASIRPVLHILTRLVVVVVVSPMLHKYSIKCHLFSTLERPRHEQAVNSREYWLFRNILFLFVRILLIKKNSL